MAFELEGLPDFIVHAQLKLSVNELPASARRLGVVDLAGARFLERPDVACLLSVILGVGLEPVAGLHCTAPALRRRTQPPLPNDHAPRYDVHRHLYLEVENTSGETLDLSDVPLTLFGIPVAVTPDGFVAAPPPLLNGDTDEIRITNASGVILSQRWLTLPNNATPRGGAGGVLSGNYPNPGFAVNMATQAELDAVIARVEALEERPSNG